jgi:hypothetical protein
MPAPGAYTYSAAALIRSQTGFRDDDIDGGSGAGKIRLRSEADVLLAEIPLDDPSGTIDGAGQLTITASGPETSAPASGDCTYGEICDSDNTVALSLPAEAGASPVSGKIVVSNLSIVAGSEVALVSATIG